MSLQTKTYTQPNINFLKYDFPVITSYTNKCLWPLVLLRNEKPQVEIL